MYLRVGVLHRQILVLGHVRHLLDLPRRHLQVTSSEHHTCKHSSHVIYLSTGLCLCLHTPSTGDSQSSVGGSSALWLVSTVRVPSSRPGVQWDQELICFQEWLWTQPVTFVNLGKGGVTHRRHTSAWPPSLSILTQSVGVACSVWGYWRLDFYHYSRPSLFWGGGTR